jgi:hypothetical protein
MWLFSVRFDLLRRSNERSEAEGESQKVDYQTIGSSSASYFFLVHG